MDRQEIIKELENIIADYLKNRALDLVDLIYRHEGMSLRLGILVDRPEGGITLGECASLNEEIGKIIDEKELLQDKYVLEVSSPGLDRPLKLESDFSRCINKKVKFFLREPVGGKLEPEGLIIKVGQGAVSADVNGEILTIPLAQINFAKQVI